MQDGLTPISVSEGGRVQLSHSFKSEDMYSCIFSEKLSLLKSVAVDNGLEQQWSCIVNPWLEHCNIKIVKAFHTSEPSRSSTSEGMPSGAKSSEDVPQVEGPDARSSGDPPREGSPQVDPTKTKSLEDMVVGLTDLSLIHI